MDSRLQLGRHFPSSRNHPTGDIQPASILLPLIRGVQHRYGHDSLLVLSRDVGFIARSCRLDFYRGLHVLAWGGEEELGHAEGGQAEECHGEGRGYDGGSTEDRECRRSFAGNQEIEANMSMDIYYVGLAQWGASPHALGWGPDGQNK